MFSLLGLTLKEIIGKVYKVIKIFTATLFIILKSINIL